MFFQRGAKRGRYRGQGCALVVRFIAVVLVVYGSWLLFVAPARREFVPDSRRARPGSLYLRAVGSRPSAMASVARRIVEGGVDVHERFVGSVVHEIDGRLAVVVDEAIAESERRRVADRYIKLTGESATDGWHREKASDASLEHNAMAKNMADEECDGAALAAIRELAPHFYEQCDASKPMWVTRCTIYAQSFVDVDESHKDRSHDALAFSVTAIWYPHERWHAHWGGETVFLSQDGGLSSTAELLFPVLPKPRRLIMFDSELTHMAKPAAVIAEPFAPPRLAAIEGALASTRTTGNRFSFVLRTLCGRETVEQLVSRHDADRDGALSRAEALALFAHLDVDREAASLNRLQRVSRPPWTASHLRTFFHIDSEHAAETAAAANP